MVVYVILTISACFNMKFCSLHCTIEFSWEARLIPTLITICNYEKDNCILFDEMEKYNERAEQTKEGL